MWCVLCNHGVRMLVGGECVWLVFLWGGRCCVYCVIIVFRMLVGGECVRLVLLWVGRCCVYCVMMVSGCWLVVSVLGWYFGGWVGAVCIV